MSQSENLHLERPTHVEIGEEILAVAYGHVFEMNGGIEGGGYEFEEAVVGTESAGFYHIPRGRTTRVVHIVGDVVFRERPIQGDGWFLGVNPKGDVIAHAFDEATPLPDVVYGKGWKVVWGAKERGARILARSEPAFTDDMEVPIAPFSPELPGKFWKKFQELEQSSKI